MHQSLILFPNNRKTLVYLLTVTPWTVPGFDVEQDLDALLALEDGLGTQDGIVLTNSAFIIEASKDRV